MITCRCDGIREKYVISDATFVEVQNYISYMFKFLFVFFFSFTFFIGYFSFYDTVALNGGIRET